jgi:hypothetical protein
VNATPFKTSGRLSAEEFFGQTDTIRSIVRNLRGKANVAIVAPPRAGKSSLLYVLFKNYQRVEPDARLWFLDMATLPALPNLIEEFFAGLHIESNDYSLAALAKHLKQLTQRAVFFIDNADRFAEPPFDDEALFAMLSSHLQRQQLSLCVTTKLTPDQVFKHHIGQPLHSLFITCDLPPFTAEESFQFVSQRLQWTGVDFDGNEIAQLYERSGGRPNELQRLAATLFKRKQARLADEQNMADLSQAKPMRRTRRS